jgi:hypothetical protein
MVDLDREASEAGKNEGMLNAELHAPLSWIEQAVDKIRRVALRLPFVTSDDVWAEGLEHPREARALGPVFKRAQSMGLVEPTEMFVLTSQVKRHRAPIRVWKSCLFGKQEASWTRERVMASIRARAQKAK